MSKHWRTVFFGVMAILAVVIVVLATPPRADAIPAFSRQYNTSCSTCHIDFPKLNDFGKAFKDAGFKFPTDDESMLKIPPVLLGAPAQSELWPKAIWPGSIPGQLPVGLRMNNYFQVVSANRGNLTGGGVTPPGTGFVPRTDFETGFFSIFTAGNFGSDIAFWADDDISVAGANANGGLGDGYLKFVNIGRFMHLPKDALTFRVGQFELDLPFTQARSYNISPYDIYTEANIGAINTLFPQQNVNNGFALADAAQGVEFSGGHQYGGYHYSVAIVNQNTGGPIDTGTNIPTATGGNNGGLGFFSDSNFKDIYGRFSYRFNLERNAESRHSIQAAGPAGPRDHTYLRLGVYDFYGRSVQRFTGTNGTLTAREPFYRLGGDFDFGYHGVFNLYGLFMYGRDHNLLPVDSEGALLPLPLATGTVISGFMNGVPATFSGGFMQADYMVYPWMMVIMRWDSVHSTADLLNGATNYPFPFNTTRNRFTPGAQFLIHANIKASFEYQIRPQQSVTVGANGLPVQPFRTNAVTAGLEFVY
jgi:hypothetical protein